MLSGEIFFPKRLPPTFLGATHGRRATRYEWKKHHHSPSSPTPHSLLPTPYLQVSPKEMHSHAQRGNEKTRNDANAVRSSLYTGHY